MIDPAAIIIILLVVYTAFFFLGNGVKQVKGSAPAGDSYFWVLPAAGVFLAIVIGGGNMGFLFALTEFIPMLFIGAILFWVFCLFAGDR